MTLDDDPWTPDTVQQMLDGGERVQRTFLTEIQRRVRGHVTPLMFHCQCLHQEGALRREDLVQIVLLRLVEADFKRLRAWRGSPAYLWGYVWGFSRNVVREACRKCEDLPPAPPEVPDVIDPRDDPSVTRDKRKIIEAVLDELQATVSARTFAVFQRIDLESKSHADVAAEFAITPLNVSQYLHQARKRLKEIGRGRGGKDN